MLGRTVETVATNRVGLRPGRGRVEKREGGENGVSMNYHHGRRQFCHVWNLKSGLLARTRVGGDVWEVRA
jgi:hypothetical protein